MKTKMSTRRKKTNSLFSLWAFALLLVCSSAVAHEQKTALTDMLYNERTQHLEIAHRISLHDAEHALYETTGFKGDLIDSTEAQAAFSKYAAKHFALTLQDKTAIPLTLVGQEIEDGYLWVYQETPIPNPVTKSYFVENAILQDVVKGQVNTVNLRYRSQVATLVFETGSGRRYFQGWETSSSP